MVVAPPSRQAQAGSKARGGKNDLTQSDRKDASAISRSYITSILLACLLIIVGLYVSLVLLASFAMLPTVLIRNFDKKEKKDLITAVTGLNFVGTILALQHSYKKYGLTPEPGVLFADWFNWLVPFGMAWLGILIFMLLPTIMAIVLEIMLQNKERRLREQQKSLLKAWGRQIRHSPTDKKHKE